MFTVIWTSILIVVCSAWTVRRLLGIRGGRWGVTALAVVVGQAGAIGILQLVTGNAFGLALTSLPLGLALAVILSMLALVIIDLLSRPAEEPRPFRIPRPLRSLRHRVGRTARYIQVTRIAVRSGLLAIGIDDSPDAGVRLGRSLATTFDRSGGLFVKLGQAMASQPQLVTPAVASELASLHDQVTPADASAALAVLREDIGPLDDAFSAFTETPIASASIGQTYLATLCDGRNVVVKVQRPGIRDSMERDLDILRRFSRRLTHRTAWARALGIDELVAGFTDATREELDFRIEAVNGSEARAALLATDPIDIPGVVSELSTARVLVQERIPGASIRTPGIFGGLTMSERKGLADALLLFIVRDMIAGGRFHADPHSGNVFLQPDGRLALLDFGAVGRLNRFERNGLLDLFRGLQVEDPALMRQAALGLGTPARRIDKDALDRELARLLTRAVQSGDRLDPAAIGEILFIFRDFGIALPRSITALFRTLYTLIGTLEVISPDYDLIGAIKRLGGSVASPILGTDSIRDYAKKEVLSLAPILSRLPGDIDDLARALVRGDVRTRVSLLSEPEDVRVIWQIVNRVLTVVTGAAGLIASAMVLSSQSGDPVGVVGFVGGIGFAFSALLLLRTVAQMLRTGQS